MIDDFNFDRALKKIKERLSVSDLDDNAGVCAFEIDREFKRVGVDDMKENDPRVRDVLEVMLTSGLLKYHVEVGDLKLDLLAEYDNLMTYVEDD